MGWKIKVASLLMLANVLVGSIFGASVYPTTAIITEIDRERDIVHCVDGIGNDWTFRGVSDNETLDIVSLLMFDNGTEKVDDDIILLHRYCGDLDTFEFIPLIWIENHTGR